MISLEYYSNNELIDKETKDFRYYPYLKMNVNGELIKSDYKDFRNSGKKEDYIIIEGKQTRGKALVRYENKVQQLSTAELKNLDTVGKAFADKKYREFLNNNYQSKILVKEGDVKYWICMQEPLLKDLKSNQRMVIWYYFLGGFNGEPLFISTGFTDVK